MLCCCNCQPHSLSSSQGNIRTKHLLTRTEEIISIPWSTEEHEVGASDPNSNTNQMNTKNHETLTTASPDHVWSIPSRIPQKIEFWAPIWGIRGTLERKWKSWEWSRWILTYKNPQENPTQIVAKSAMKIGKIAPKIGKKKNSRIRGWARDWFN